MDELKLRLTWQLHMEEVFLVGFHPESPNHFLNLSQEIHFWSKAIYENFSQLRLRHKELLHPASQRDMTDITVWTLYFRYP